MSAETYRGYPRLISQYVTPPALGDTLTCRLILLPDHGDIRRALLDVVQMLGNPESWIESQYGETREDIASIFTDIVNQLTDKNPMIGAIIPFMTNDLPAHVLPCNGNTYNRADYPDLYDLLPTGLIIDVDTFRTPDLTDRVPRGTNELNAINDAGGNDSITLTVDQMPTHTHTTNPHQHTFFKNLPIGIDLEGIGAPDPTAVSNTPIMDWTSYETVTVNNAGNGQPINITPQYIAVNYAIVAR